MKVQFMLEFGDEMIGVGKFKECEVVETYYDPESYGRGYDIIEVEVLGIWEIKIRMGDGKVYIAEDAEEFKDGSQKKWYVSLWAPFEEAM